MPWRECRPPDYSPEAVDPVKDGKIVRADEYVDPNEIPPERLAEAPGRGCAT